MVNWVKNVEKVEDYPEIYEAELLDGRELFIRYDMGVLLVAIKEGVRFKTIEKMIFGDVGDIHLKMSECDMKILLLDIVEKYDSKN